MTTRCLSWDEWFLHHTQSVKLVFWIKGGNARKEQMIATTHMHDYNHTFSPMTSKSWFSSQHALAILFKLWCRKPLSMGSNDSKVRSPISLTKLCKFVFFRVVCTLLPCWGAFNVHLHSGAGRLLNLNLNPICLGRGLNLLEGPTSLIAWKPASLIN